MKRKGHVPMPGFPCDEVWQWSCVICSREVTVRPTARRHKVGGWGLRTCEQARSLRFLSACPDHYESAVDRYLAGR